MTIIPVLDILNGVVVHGVAGRREEYRPIQSRLADTPEPLAIARAFREEYCLEELYLADLDGLMHGRPRLDVARELSADGFKLMVDAGTQSVEEASRLLAAGASRIIAALESSDGPDSLSELVHELSPDRVIFSLDLKDGRPIPRGGGWQGLHPEAIIDAAIDCGVRSVIVLDLASVGTSRGLTTLPLCRHVVCRHPSVEVITGGGVRTAADLRAAADAGVDGLLVASALHSGELRGVTARSPSDEAWSLTATTLNSSAH
jgi:HisA/HisF family protein